MLIMALIALIIHISDASPRYRHFASSLQFAISRRRRFAFLILSKGFIPVIRLTSQSLLALLAAATELLDFQ